MKFRVFILINLLLCFISPVHALRVKVAVDGAAVYQRPDFDSEVIDYLNQGVPIAASHKLFAGKRGLGSFHKIKTKSGKLGFIADTDVIVPKGANIVQPKQPGQSVRPQNVAKQRPPPKKRRHQHNEDEEGGNQGIFFTRYMGGSAAFVDYTEKFSGRKLHEQAPFVGFRMSGPGTLFEGPPLDFNIAISPRPPKYLSAFGTGNATGFLLIGDVMLLLPLAETKNSLFNYGLGLMWTFSDYAVQVGKQSYDSKEFRIGIDFDIGWAYRFSRIYLLRADLKYYIEKNMYLSELVSLQVEY